MSAEASDLDLAQALDDWDTEEDQDVSKEVHNVGSMTAMDGQQPATEGGAAGLPATHDNQCSSSGTLAADTHAAAPSDAAAAAAAAPIIHMPASKAAAAAPLHLLSLPKEVLQRMFSFLSADDLCNVPVVCSAVRALSEEQMLWRRLYCARWGKPQAQQGDASWKEQYKLKDAEELRGLTRMVAGDGGADVQMKALFIDMQRAKRQQTLGRGLVDDPMEVPRCAVQERLAAWRKAHPPQPLTPGTTPQPQQQHGGVLYPPTSPTNSSSSGAYTSNHSSNNNKSHPSALQPQLVPSPLHNPQLQSNAGQLPNFRVGHRSVMRRSGTSGHRQLGAPHSAPKPDLSGPQGRDAYQWDQIGDYYCCRETGWVHLCDSTCKEAVIDPVHEQLVCPISCRTVDRMLNDCELRSIARTRAGPPGHDEADNAFDFAGFVGRAYEAGYSCRNERELRRVCGVRL